jgi:hypothetical protein
MSFASPVWKKFIFPPFPRLAESPTLRGSSAQKKKKTDEAFPDVELDFTEDNGDALLILLQIAHLQVANIPNDSRTKLYWGLRFFVTNMIVENWSNRGSRIGWRMSGTSLTFDVRKDGCLLLIILVGAISSRSWL